MLDQPPTALCLTAATIAVLHTLLGPDHYVPFVAMGRARNWSLPKTLLVTALCGAGHVVGSALLGLIGIAIGTAVFTLESVEAARGEIAGWMLIAFGLAYLAWGLRRAFRNRPHAHLHAHADGTVHTHNHVHERDHVHVHSSATESGRSITVWVLFTIFLFGPCEPLIPMLMYPAATGARGLVILVAAVFSAFTIATMLASVLAAWSMTGWAWTARFERFSHALAGFAVFTCGLAVTFGL